MTVSDTPPPLTDGDLEFIRDAVERRTDHYSDRQRLLAEVDRFRSMKCATCGKRIGYLNYKGYLLGWGCADGDECAENAMAAEIDRLRDEVATISRGMDEMDHENQRLRAENTALAAKLAVVRGLSGNESMSQGHRFGYESALKDVRAALSETGGTES